MASASLEVSATTGPPLPPSPPLSSPNSLPPPLPCLPPTCTCSSGAGVTVPTYAPRESTDTTARAWLVMRAEEASQVPPSPPSACVSVTATNKLRAMVGACHRLTLLQSRVLNETDSQGKHFPQLTWHAFSQGSFLHLRIFSSSVPTPPSDPGSVFAQNGGSMSTHGGGGGEGIGGGGGEGGGRGRRRGRGRGRGRRRWRRAVLLLAPVELLLACNVWLRVQCRACLFNKHHSRWFTLYIMTCTRGRTCRP